VGGTGGRGAPASRRGIVAGPDDWAGFSAVWLKGFERIYTIRLARGRLSVNDSVRHHPSMLLRWLAFAYAPGLVTLLVLAIYPHWWPPSERVALILVLATINGGAFAAAALAWGYAVTRSRTIDDLLRPCQQRDRVVSVIGRAVEHDRQAILPLIAGLLPWVINAFDGGYRTHAIVPYVLLLLNITWTLTLTTNDAYWLLVPPLITLRMLKCHDIRLRWNDPARTEGVRTLSEGFVYPAFFVALGALAVTVPGLMDHQIFGHYLIYLFLWLIILSLWNGVFTQACLYAIVRRFKLRLLDRLTSDRKFVFAANENISLDRVVFSESYDSNRLTMYNVIAAAPGLPFGTGIVIQYAAAILGSIAGFVLQSPHILG
jgi:hypothetical protein